jgi:hypothetical protein
MQLTYHQHQTNDQTKKTSNERNKTQRANKGADLRERQTLNPMLDF